MKVEVFRTTSGDLWEVGDTDFISTEYKNTVIICPKDNYAELTVEDIEEMLQELKKEETNATT